MDAAVALDSRWLCAVLLLSLRLGATLAASPILAPASVPGVVRVLVVLGLSATLLPALPSVPGAGLDLVAGGLGPLLAAAFAELALGATLGLGIQLAFSAISLAGQLIGVQMGFGLGQVIDPSSRASTPVIAAAFSQVGVLLLFLTNGHHALLRGLAFSVERFPLGAGWPVAAAVGPVLRQVAGLFTLGFALAAPVVFCLLLVEMALGVVARNLPQVNMIAIGIPAKVVAGLLALALWSAGLGDALTRVYAGLYRTWEGIFVAEVQAPARGAARIAGVPVSGPWRAS